MIHPPAIRVTCDGPDCDPEQVFLHPSTVSLAFSPLPIDAVERWLIRDHHWIVRDGQHFCCQVCAQAARLTSP